MNRTSINLAAASICIWAANASATTFDGETNSIPNGAMYSDLIVGESLPDTLVLLGSNSMASVSEYVILGYNDGSSNNVLRIEDGSALVVGSAAAPTTNGLVTGNQLYDAAILVDNQSTIESTALRMGSSAGETAVINVENGSMLDTDGDANIGAAGDNNVVNVKDDSVFSVAGSLTVGTTNTSGNSVNVDGDSTLKVSGLDKIDIADNNNVTINGTLETDGDVSSLELSNTKVDFRQGSTVLVNSNFNGNVEGGFSIALNEDATWNTPADGAARLGRISDGNAMTIGHDTSLSLTNGLYVGGNGNSNTLNLETDATLAVNDVNIGERGDANNLNLSSNAMLNVAGSLKIGVNASASNNGLSLTENASLTASELIVGDRGSNNRLTQTGGSTLITNDFVIGARSGSNGNRAQLSGSNTLLSARSAIVGLEGASNRLEVQDGANLSLTDSLVLGAESDNNQFTLSGSNSIVNVGDSLVAGDNGSENLISVTGGEMNIANDLYLGTANNASGGNELSVRGEHAKVGVDGALFVGSNISSNNSVTIADGGRLFVSAQTNIVFGSATNNTLTVKNEGWLESTDWDMSYLSSNLTFEAGAGLSLSGVFSGTNTIDNGFNLELDGPSASWSDTNLFVGVDSGNNSLTLTNGATATALENLTIGLNSADNVVTVGGAGSLINVMNDLFIGSESNNSTYNTLAVLDGASLMVGNDASLFRGAKLQIDSKSQANIAGDYSQDQFSTLQVGVSSNQIAPNLVVGGTANFASSPDTNQYSIIEVYSEGVSESNTIAIVKAKEIKLDGNKATGGSIEGNIASNSLLGFTVTLTNDVNNYYIVLSDFLERTIGEAGDLDGQLLAVSEEIELLKDAGNSNAIAQVRIIEGLQPEQIQPVMDGYYGETASSVPANNIINMGLQNVAEQLTIRADNTRSRAAAPAPVGAEGPHSEGQQLQGWINAYGSKGSLSAASGFGGYDSSLSGFLIGADLAVANGVLVGVAGGTGNGTADKKNGGQSDTRTTYGAIYTSLGNGPWFADASFIYGGSSVDYTLGQTFDTRGEFDANNAAFYVGGGKEIAGNYLILTPYASLLANYYKQDAYDEKATNAVAREIEGFDTFYLQSTIGGSMAWYMGLGNITLKPEIRLFWQHEFNNDEQDVRYRLIGGNGANYTLFYQAPEDDILKIGIGTSAKMGEYLELRADLDSRQSKNYSDYTLLGSIRYQF